MSEYDYYVPEDVKREEIKTVSHTQRAAKTSGNGFYSEGFFEPERKKALPEIIIVSSPQEADKILSTKGNVVVVYSMVLEHDRLESRKVSKYPEPDKYEIHAEGLPIGLTNNGEIDLDKLKEALVN